MFNKITPPKKIYPIIILLCLITTAIPTQGNLAKKSTTRNDNQQSNRFVEQGGFQTDVHILNQEEKLIIKRFTPNTMEPFVHLLNQLRGGLYFQKWQNEGKIDYQGKILKQSVNLGFKTRHHGQHLTLKDVIQWSKQSYTPFHFFKKLQDAGIIDKQGYVASISEQSVKDTENFDFQNLQNKIQNFSFGFGDQKLTNQLRNSLFDYLKIKSTVINITQEETTRYQSREENFIDAFFDAIGGNIIGSIFFKDKVQVLSEEKGWKPSIDLDQYLAPYYLGFANTPYYSTLDGLSIINGNSTLTEVSVGHINQDPDSLLNINWQNRTLTSTHPASIWENHYILTSVKYQHLEQDSNKNEYYQVSLGIGGIGENHYAEFYGGLTGYKTDGETSIGINFGGSAEWYVLKPFSLYLEGTTSFQPGKNNITNWGLNQIGLGSAIHLDRAKIKLGYMWNTNADLDSLVNGFYIQGSLFL